MADPVIRVHVTDLLTGDEETVQLEAGNYVVTATEPCRVDHTQVFPMRGTHVLTIKGVKA
jgi:hypothetical protein